MKLDRALPREPRERYDEVRYRDSLRALGLFPPIALEDIHRAYKWRARKVHPDRFTDADEKAEATRRIQRINQARDYAVAHFRGFALYQAKAYGRANGNGRAAARRRESLPTWALLPVTAVHAMAMLVAAAPFLAAGRLAGRERLGRLRGRWGRSGVFAWRAWLAFGPHVVTAAALLVADGLVLEAWLGGSLLVMVAGDVATGVTGDENTLREHPAVHRAQSIVDGLAPAI